MFKSSCEQYYEGEWYEGKRHGQGKMIYNKKGTVSYSGEWCNGNRQGYGIMRYASGNNYEGYWNNDKKSGRGYMIWKDLDELYCGDWLNDLPHGNGEHIWGDSSSKLATRQLCNIYRGSFEGGVRSGLGTFFYSNGSQYSGTWLNNMKHGDGIFISAEGLIQAVIFDKDRIVSTYISDPTLVNEIAKRTSDDISPQFRINITDLLHKIPKSVPISRLPVTKEIERLLLKYNSYIKTFFRRYADASVKITSREIRDVSITDPYTTTWPKIEKLIFQHKNIYKRMNCMTLDMFRRFLREVGLFTHLYNSFDMCATYLRMTNEHKTVAISNYYSMKKSLNSTANCTPSESRIILGLLDVDETLLSYQVETVSSIDPRQPLREREFCELLIRVLIEIFIKKGLTNRTVDDYIYEFLGTVIYPLCSNDSLRDPFATAFYTDIVSVPLTSSVRIDAIWQEVSHRSNNQVKLLHVVAYCKETLKGIELDEGFTTASILRAIYPSLAPVDSDVDHSVLGNHIDKSDFYEIICRLISCDLWVLGKPKPVTSAVEEEILPEDESSSEAKMNPVTDTTVGVAVNEEEEKVPLENKISKRLQAWFTDLIERKKAVEEQI